MLTILGQVFELQILFLLQHGVRVDVGDDLLFLELGWVHIFADFGLFEDCLGISLLFLYSLFLVISAKSGTHQI